MQPVYITGIGYTRIYRFYEKSLEDLVYEAVAEAVKEHGSVDIDTLIVSNSFSPLLQSQNLLASLIAEDLGLRGLSVYNIENGSVGGLSAVNLAWKLIAGGLSKNILVVGVEKLSDYRSKVMYRALTQLTNNDYEGFYGATTLSQYALVAREYLEKYSLPEEMLAEWPVLMHENASNTPHAQLRFKITKEKVNNSNYASKPLRQLHLPPMSDGAAAVILSPENAEIKKDSRLARIAYSTVSNGIMEASLKENLTELDSLKNIADKMHGVDGEWNKKLDVIDLTDHYSIGGPIILENLGITDKGKTLEKIKDGGLRPGDKITVNPTGGTKARGNPIGATGVYQIAELAGILAGYNVAGRGLDAERAAAIGVSGLGGVAVGVLLEKV